MRGVVVSNQMQYLFPALFTINFLEKLKPIKATALLNMARVFKKKQLKPGLPAFMFRPNRRLSRQTVVGPSYAARGTLSLH